MFFLLFVYHPILFIYSLISAEQWNLANPLQTCGFQVERRDNDLYLLFTTDNHTKLFALAKCDANPSHSVESVVDSSRYFVAHIQDKTNTKQSGLIGFGFRERDIAIDLLGNLQQFQKSIEREMRSKNMKVAEIPQLGEGDRIHISFGGKKTKSKSMIVKDEDGSGEEKRRSSAKSSPTILLKKPPKFTAEDRDIRLSMGDIDLDLEHEMDHKDDDSEDSEQAIGGGKSVDTDDLSANDLDNDTDDDDWGGFQEATPDAKKAAS
jgi:hypothetical protein